MNKDQTPTQEKQEEEQAYFFPNTQEGLPYSCKATSRAKAEVANAEYLKQQKASNN